MDSMRRHGGSYLAIVAARPAGRVRSSLSNGHQGTAAGCPKSANKRLMHRSNSQHYFNLLVGARQRMIWSLTHLSTFQHRGTFGGHCRAAAGGRGGGGGAIRGGGGGAIRGGGGAIRGGGAAIRGGGAMRGGAAIRGGSLRRGGSAR